MVFLTKPALLHPAPPEQPRLMAPEVATPVEVSVSVNDALLLLNLICHW
jgi:hypothetical protein